MSVTSPRCIGGSIRIRAAADAHFRRRPHASLHPGGDRAGSPARRTAAFATYNEAEQALVITATHGYPSAIVEHVRIQPGEGVIGRAFVVRACR